MERMEVLSMSRDGCPVAGVLEIIGERWTVLVIREAFFGLRRFDDFHRAVGCARNILTARLARLVEHGVMQKVPYRDEGQRERFEYRLTPKGHELYPVIQSLRQWGDRWLSDGEGPLEVFHRECGGRVFAEVRCEHGHGPLAARETDAMAVARRRRPVRARKNGSTSRPRG
jgi:DNA-binding HxlR family transcriptional regulator